MRTLFFKDKSFSEVSSPRVNAKSDTSTILQENKRNQKTFDIGSNARITPTNENNTILSPRFRG